MLNLNFQKLFTFFIFAIFSTCFSKSNENEMNELKKTYNKVCDIYRNKVFAILEKDSIKYYENNNNQIIIIPYLIIIDTLNYFNGNKTEFYKSISFDTSFKYKAYVKIDKKFYKYSIWNGKVVWKDYPKINSDGKADLIFENKYKYLVEGCYLSHNISLSLWYIDFNEIKSIAKWKVKYKNSKENVDINLFDDIRESQRK